MLHRSEQILDGLHQVENLYLEKVAPIEAFILQRKPDSTLVKRIAWGIVVEAHRADLPLDLAMGILLVENPDFDPKAKSFVGATGLAQVMPLHVGRWPPCRDNDLYRVEDNLCMGFHIFRDNLARFNGDVNRALLTYNGCVRGTNTPDCHFYPTWVKSRMAFARRVIWNVSTLQ